MMMMYLINWKLRACVVVFFFAVLAPYSPFVILDYAFI